MSIADKLTAIAENVQRVYDAGKAAGGGEGDSFYDTFWDAYQANGNRTGYQYAFSYTGWNDETFKPKYNICPSGSGSGSYVFYNSRIKTSEYLSKIDFSKSPCAVQTFFGSTIEELGVLDFGSVVQGWNGLQQTFTGCSKLRKIGLLIPPRDKTAKVDAFSSLSSLTDITFGGTIYNNISFAGTPINVASLKSAIEWLEDYSGTTTTRTLTLGTTNQGKLTDEEIAIATEKGWTVV